MKNKVFNERRNITDNRVSTKEYKSQLELNRDFYEV